MGKKSVQCFSWYKRRKDCRRGPHCPPQPVSSVEEPALPPSLSWASSRGGGGAQQVYFSHKARVTYRHQMDGNIIDDTC